MKIKVQKFTYIKSNTNLVLGSISSVFNQLEYLENKLKDNLNDIKTPFGLYSAKNPSEREGVTQDSRTTGCTPLPDYILVTSVTTEVFPVPAIPSMVIDQEEEEIGWDIPVMVGKKATGDT